MRQWLAILALAMLLAPVVTGQEKAPPPTAPPATAPSPVPPPETQAPPASTPLPATAEPTPNEIVQREVADFYADYWKAWENRDAVAIGDHLAQDFLSFSYVPNQGVVQIDKAAALASVRQFIDAVRGKQVQWGRSLLSVVPRGQTEAVAAVRNDFLLANQGGDVELTVEVLRKGADGRWRLERKWSERVSF